MDGSRARRVRRALLASISACAVLAVAAEALLRSTLDVEQVLSGDDLWVHRWLARRAGASLPQGEMPLDRTDGVHRHDPLLGWAPRENLRGAGISTNSRGARGTREDAVPKPAGEQRIVVVGDSFTWGHGVADAEAWPEVLERLLPGSRAVNLAVSGYGTDQAALRLERDGLALEPDLVVIGFLGPGADRNLLGFRDYAKPRYLLEGGALRLVGVPVPDPADPGTVFEEPRPPCWTLAWARARLRGLQDRTRRAPKWELTRAILDASLETCRARGARVLLAHFPPKREAFAARPDVSEEVLREWASSSGVAFAPLREAFLELAPGDRGRVYHDHWTPFGNEVVARAVARAIREAGL